MTPHEALTRALVDMAETRRRPPCAADPERWTSDDSRTRAEAAEDCQSCPIRAAGVVAGSAEPAHVWGGSDRTPTTRKTP